MNNPVDEWNEIFGKYGDRIPRCDDWLDKYKGILEYSRDTPIIDLGCGFGNNSLYLSEGGYDTISCDFSIESLKIIKRLIPNSETRLFNILDGLPFENGSIKLIIADLSLHYFTWEDTVRVVNDISRVLGDNGCLLCRVNSVRDDNYGAGQGTLIEENYYNVNGRLKRFFNITQLEELFSKWNVRYLKECNMSRYKEKKIVWEIAALKGLLHS